MDLYLLLLSTQKTEQVLGLKNVCVCINIYIYISSQREPEEIVQILHKETMIGSQAAKVGCGHTGPPSHTANLPFLPLPENIHRTVSLRPAHTPFFWVLEKWLRVFPIRTRLPL